MGEGDNELGNQIREAVTGLVQSESTEDRNRRSRELLAEMFDSPASIYGFDSADELVLQTTTAPSVTEAERTVPVSKWLLEQTAAFERATVIDDCTATRSAAASAPNSDPYRSAMLVPIDDTRVLIVADPAPNVFDEDDRKRAELVASLLTAASPESTVDSVDEKLERIASVLSHDLVNPLMVARAYVEHTRQSGDLEKLERVELALDRIDELTSGLEWFARTGQTVEDVEAVDLEVAASVAWAMVDTENASIENAANESILADEHRLHQLLENLCSNAVVHGGSDVTVSVGSLADGSGFFVEDDGPGISRDRRSHVFEHGFSGTDDRSGYGLSIVQAIVDAHDWSIAIAEADSGGARFEIRGVESVASRSE